MIAPKLPSLEDLAPELEKLEIHPNSIVLIAIEDCRVTWGWFSAAERRALRVALERARKRRVAAENKFSSKAAQRPNLVHRKLLGVDTDFSVSTF